MYRVGLKFEHPDDELRNCVAAVLHELAARRPLADDADQRM
jgi:hypothetical protein